MRSFERIADGLLVEIHKKYSIPVACLVFVVIGAPLGFMARRGGIATGGGLSLGFFLLYWTFLIGGEDLADRQIISPFLAMWSANFVVGAAGLYLLWRVAKESLTMDFAKLWRWRRT
jgi:lipopolysaccharide export system permease protein